MIAELLTLTKRAEGPKFYISVEDLINYLTGDMDINQLSSNRKTMAELADDYRRLQHQASLANQYRG